VIAFAEDPTGYKWELIQRAKTEEPLCQVGAGKGRRRAASDFVCP
jgi:hypothetical protein